MVDINEVGNREWATVCVSNQLPGTPIGGKTGRRDRQESARRGRLE